VKNKKIKIMASVVILVIIVIFFIAGLITLKNTNKSNDESNKEVKIEIKQEKNASAVVLKVTSVDGLISISNEQIAKMTDYDKKHVISVTEHLSINKGHGTDFSTFGETIKYEYDKGIISENSEEAFWNYVESHGGLDTWLKGTLEYCFGNENGVYNLYEIINPEGEKSDTYTATQSGTYTFTVKDLLYNKEYKKTVEVTVEK
jgi:hypothetical protein